MLVMDEDIEPQNKVGVRYPMGIDTNPGEKSKRCSESVTLRRHVQGHSEDKSNKCKQCDFASTHSGSLSRHLKTHSGEMSNICNQCNYASFHASNLRAHLKTYSGEKSNKCNQCDFVS